MAVETIAVRPGRASPEQTVDRMRQKLAEWQAKKAARFEESIKSTSGRRPWIAASRSATDLRCNVATTTCVDDFPVQRKTLAPQCAKQPRTHSLGDRGPPPSEPSRVAAVAKENRDPHEQMRQKLDARRNKLESAAKAAVKEEAETMSLLRTLVPVQRRARLPGGDDEVYPRCPPSSPLERCLPQQLSPQSLSSILAAKLASCLASDVAESEADQGKLVAAALDSAADEAEESAPMRPARRRQAHVQQCLFDRLEEAAVHCSQGTATEATTSISSTSSCLSESAASSAVQDVETLDAAQTAPQEEEAQPFVTSPLELLDLDDGLQPIDSELQGVEMISKLRPPTAFVFPQMLRKCSSDGCLVPPDESATMDSQVDSKLRCPRAWGLGHGMRRCSSDVSLVGLRQQGADDNNSRSPLQEGEQAAREREVVLSADRDAIGEQTQDREAEVVVERVEPDESQAITDADGTNYPHANLLAQLREHVLDWPALDALTIEDHLSRAFDIRCFSFFEARDRARQRCGLDPQELETLECIHEHPPTWPRWKAQSYDIREAARAGRRQSRGDSCDASTSSRPRPRSGGA